jgi:hypothetical protein
MISMNSLLFRMLVIGTVSYISVIVQSSGTKHPYTGACDFNLSGTHINPKRKKFTPRDTATLLTYMVNI